MSTFRFAILYVAFALAISQSARSQVVNSQWNTGNGNWNVATNWTPNAIPDNGGGFTYNVQIGNLAPANVQLTFVPEDGTSDTISSLDITDAADLFTNGFQIFVAGQTTVDGIGASIRIDPHATPGTFSLDTDNLDVNGGGGLQMNGGIANVDILLEVNAASVIQGHGTVDVGDNDAIVEEAFENSGFIRPTSNAAAPQTLTIQTNGVDTIDLDGDTDTGVVDVDNVSVGVNVDTTTLVIDGPLSDSFSGTLQIGQRDTVTFNDNFTMIGADVQLDGGANTATINGPAAVTSIASSAFAITGDVVIDNNMTFSGTLNTIVLNASSTLTLNGTVAIPDASALDLTAAAQTLVIGGDTSVAEAAGDFDWDNAVTTVTAGGNLALAVDQIDLGNDIYNGTLNLNDGGDVSVNVTAASWEMDGVLTKNGASISGISGDRMLIGGTVNANAGTLDLPSVTLQNTANVNVAGTLTLGPATEFLGPATLTGAGLLRMEGTSTVSVSTTVNVATFDWDGFGTGTTHTINDGVNFTINSTMLDNDGDMDDPVHLGGNGAQLFVSGPASWTQTGIFHANTAAAGTATIGGTSRAIFQSTVNVDGLTVADAPVTFGATSTTAIDVAMSLRLSGGTLVDVNRIEGGAVNGPGTMRADHNSGLAGFGTLNAPIDFDGFSTLKADDGTLTINGAISDVGSIGTSDDDGVLSVTNAWNSNVADFVDLLGGELAGGTLTIGNAQGVTGFGLISARVVNEQRIRAQAGTLIAETALDNNDWDGAGGDGALEAAPGRTLELRDTGAAFGFTGIVKAEPGGRVFSNGFALDFNLGSAINLTEGTYESTNSTDIGGAVTVNAGADSTFKVKNNSFLTFENGSSSTLNANLRLENNNIIVEAGATFSGTGALIVPDGSHMVAEAGADIGVLLDMQGAFRPGNSEGIATVDVKDYQSSSTSELFIEIVGTALNAFDRLDVNGTAIVDGFLSLDIDGVFVPTLGQTFPIITTSGARLGTFDTVDVSGMPAGLAFHINYLSNAVQLEVVNKPFYEADFDDDGDVDTTDLSIWQNAFDLNQLGDADADNDSDGNDFLIWQRQVSGAPVVPAAAPVPEPDASLLALAAILAGLAQRLVRRPKIIAEIGRAFC